MATVALNNALNERFGPVARDSGFRGSGQTYRRLRGEVIHVVNAQGARAGGAFAVNLGVQLAFLPTGRGEPPDPRKLLEMECDFRGRMSETGQDQWWSYTNESDAGRAVTAMVDVWLRRGLAQLEALGTYPESFAKLTAGDLESGNYNFGGLGGTLGRLSLVFARIRAHEGRSAEARAFIGLGLSAAGERATSLKRDLRDLENAL